MESSSKDVKKQPAIKFDDGRSEEKLPLKSAIVGKGGNGVKYEGLQVPRIVKRTSNLSVEPQYGSDSDLRIFGKKNFLQAKKRQAGSVLIAWFFLLFDFLFYLLPPHMLQSHVFSKTLGSMFSNPWSYDLKNRNF